MGNLLLQDVEFKVAPTRWGLWREYLYESGQSYREFRSYATIAGMPLLHYTRGRNPATGRTETARGFLAVGRKALGVVAVGQLAIGVVAIGQLALGMLLGLGQAALGAVAVGQLAAALGFALGQFAAGYVAIGQLALGHYVLAQMATGACVWTSRVVSPEAAEFFRSLPVIGPLLP
ncbi:MAG: hypothetical protein JW810_05900 [Sedimentisphaerales bacterium]|nr:hypothetical protein [Sedimentisphaerales bacterium]